MIGGKVNDIGQWPFVCRISYIWRWLPFKRVNINIQIFEWTLRIYIISSLERKSIWNRRLWNYVKLFFSFLASRACVRAGTNPQLTWEKTAGQRIVLCANARTQHNSHPNYPPIHRGLFDYFISIDVVDAADSVLSLLMICARKETKECGWAEYWIPEENQQSAELKIWLV